LIILGIKSLFPKTIIADAVARKQAASIGLLFDVAFVLC